MNSFSEKFPSNCSFGLLWVESSERLHSKDSQLKTRKESKGLKLHVFYGMATLKLKRLKENARVGVPF